MSFLLWLGILACSTPTVSTAPSNVDVIAFPHANDYKQASLHGSDALSFGAAACQTCHRENGRAAPTCASCHPGYPHTEGWLSGQVHGKGLMGETGEAARQPCLECHGTEGLVAASEHGCNSCHENYPHVEGWELAGQHGVYALSRGSATAACGSCHGTHLEGNKNAPACTKCHSDYPHADGWTAANQHPSPHAVAAASDFARCETCHGAGGTGGKAEVACAQCHASYPHPDEWVKTHYATVDKVGEGSCALCHAAGFADTVLPVSCGKSCHGGAQ